MTNLILVEYSEDGKKGSIVFDKKTKQKFYFNVIIPETLVHELGVSKEIILRYHTSAQKVETTQQSNYSKTTLLQDLKEFLGVEKPKTTTKRRKKSTKKTK
jgi:hypothetical protein